jgi:hypothetical protein
MSLINPVSKHLETGDKVTAPARPRRVSPRAPLRDRLVMPGKQPTAIPESIVGALAVLQGMQGQLLDQLERAGDTPVLWSGTDMVQASGLTGHHFQVQYKAVHVANLGTHPMTVLSGPPNDTVNPQQSGAGVFPLLGGHWLTMPAVANSLTIIGTAGDMVRIACYGIALPAAAGPV